jgi:hypothetical protein
MCTITTAIAESNTPLESVKRLIQRTGGDMSRMAGPDMAGVRKDWMNYLGMGTGDGKLGRFTKAASGVNALRAAVYAYAKAHGFDESYATCEADKERRLTDWATF